MIANICRVSTAVMLMCMVAAPLPAEANECARIASASYSADRSISGPDGSETVKVYVSGLRKREEGTMQGRPEVRINDGPGKPMVVFNPVDMIGIRVPGRRASGGQGISAQTTDGGDGTVTTRLMAPVNGVMTQVSQMTCRKDGVLIEARHTQPNPDGSARGTIVIRDNNVSVGGQPASLFAVPAGIKFVR